VVERRHDPSFGDEPGAYLCIIGECRGKGLDVNRATELSVNATPDHAESAAANLFAQLVARERVLRSTDPVAEGRQRSRRRRP
jgi:hypothetical protein